MSRRFGRVGAVAAACVAGGIAVVALTWTAPDAVGQTAGAQLSMTGAMTADAPGGTDRITITAGDSIVFSLAKPPVRANAGLLGYNVTINAGAFPSGPASVKLTSGQTYTVTFPSAHSYPFSWTPANGLGRIGLRSGEYTSATVVVLPAPSDPSPTQDPPSGSTGSTPGTTGASSSGTSTGTGTVSAPGLPGIPGATGSLTPGTILGFGGPGFRGPGADPGLPGASVVVTTNANGVVVTQPVLANAAAQGANTPNDPEFAADPHVATPPRALAVVSILALACVAGAYAYMYLGQRALRASNRH